MEVSSGIEFKVASALPAPVSTVGAGRDAEELAGNAFRNSFFWDARDKILYVAALYFLLSRPRFFSSPLLSPRPPPYTRVLGTCIETDSPQHVRVNILHCCYIAWRTYATTSTI